MDLTIHSSFLPHTDLEADGAEVVQEPTEQPNGVRDCAFRDPAGNMIRIQELR
jgi:catechol 2,3-dioxygenase-like lactoylglutathione lyase family enzyme